MGCDIYFDLHAPVDLRLVCYACGKPIERNQNNCIIGHEQCVLERGLPCSIETNGQFR